MNFFRKFLHLADIVLLLILMLQVFEVKEQMTASGVNDMQTLKEAIFQSGKELFADVWEDIFGDEENGAVKENVAGKSCLADENKADENGMVDENGDPLFENFCAGNVPGEAGSDEKKDPVDSSGISDSDEAAVSFAREEELTVETAAAIESVQEITVLITNKGEGGYWHSTLSFSFAADVLLTSGESVTYLEAGETLNLDAADYEVGETLNLDVTDYEAGETPEPDATDNEAGETPEPDAADYEVGEAVLSEKINETQSDSDTVEADSSTGKESAVFALDFSAESGGSDTRTYAGTMEITVTEDGFLLRNTLPLEEYLRYVVPAEMPASCPEEALKAQTICARTYALRTAAGGAFAKYGADISDDTSCQVYNTQGTDERTDAAVLATAGEYLIFDGGPAECYYFSTSCGVTTDASIWGEVIPYLKSILVCSISEKTSETGTEEAFEEESETGTERTSENGSVTANADGSESETTSEIGELLKNEEYLQNFLDDTSGIESDEPWYRWEATFSVKVLKARLEEDIGDIVVIEVTERGSGGVAAELTVYGSSGQEVIESQYAIREFFRLGDGTSCTRHDGTVVSDPMFLPSAFFYIRTESDGTVTLVGGGFGHGCGMSQNAAKAYAEAGADAYEILSLFYSGTKIYRAGA